MSSFDLAAKDYDKQFTTTCVGIAQRERVWNYVNAIGTVANKKVLEVNCGTGKDASIWHSKGHSILATDISQKMIDQAKKKYPMIDFRKLNITDLGILDDTFDIIFSNFGGLNCLSPDELNRFFNNAHSRLNPGGSLQLVIMGKKCLWDRLFLILKGRRKERNRRNTTAGIPINVDGESVMTWYYSPKEIRALAEGKYDHIRFKPVGLFIPPSYLAGTFEKRKFSFALLRFLEKSLSFSFFSNYADHYFISMTKKAQ